jgi:DNA-binding MarR family transcriptional regulator
MTTPDPRKRQTMPDRSIPDTSRHVMWLLKRAFHNGHRAVNDAIHTYGVTPPQVGVLNRLAHEPGLSGADLARRLLLTPQAAQLAVSALEQRGLVERKPDPTHGRIVRTFLTKEGRRVYKLCIDRSLRAEAEFLSVLTPAEVTSLTDFLSRLAIPRAGTLDGSEDAVAERRA